MDLKANKGDDSIPDALCLLAIEALQLAVARFTLTERKPIYARPF
jgi:hypothetical protein